MIVVDLSNPIYLYLNVRWIYVIALGGNNPEGNSFYREVFCLATGLLVGWVTCLTSSQLICCFICSYIYLSFMHRLRSRVWSFHLMLGNPCLQPMKEFLWFRHVNIALLRLYCAVPLQREDSRWRLVIIWTLLLLWLLTTAFLEARQVNSRDSK